MPRRFEPAIDLPTRRRKNPRPPASKAWSPGDAAADADAHSLPGDGVQPATAATRASTDADDDDGGSLEVDKPNAFPHAPLAQTFDLPLPDDPVSEQPHQQRNLKHQHFAVLNAIMHRSLLDGDYDRAARAFGLLLRTELNGRRLDLRKKALWGIGAEILLHTHGARNTGAADPLHARWFSDEGFAAVKKYLERLCLQYAWRRSHPNDVTELTFYPVMLGWWIFQVQSRYAAYTERHVQRAHDEDVDMGLDDQDDDTDAWREQTADVYQILEAIEAKIRSPPFDRSSTMLQMHADVLAWLADLAASVPEDEPMERDLRSRAAAARARHARFQRGVPGVDQDEDQDAEDDR